MKQPPKKKKPAERKMVWKGDAERAAATPKCDPRHALRLDPEDKAFLERHIANIPVYMRKGPPK